MFFRQGKWFLGKYSHSIIMLESDCYQILVCASLGKSALIMGLKLPNISPNTFTNLVATIFRSSPISDSFGGVCGSFPKVKLWDHFLFSTVAWVKFERWWCKNCRSRSKDSLLLTLFSLVKHLIMEIWGHCQVYIKDLCRYYGVLEGNFFGTQ